MTAAPLYLRREPSTDPTLLAALAASGGRHEPIYRDVVGYLDRECTQRVATWPWHYSTRPKKGITRRVMLNCHPRRVTWLDDLPHPGDVRTPGTRVRYITEGSLPWLKSREGLVVGIDKRAGWIRVVFDGDGFETKCADVHLVRVEASHGAA